MHSSCFSPTLRLSPFSETYRDKSLISERINHQAVQSSFALKRLSKLDLIKGFPDFFIGVGTKGVNIDSESSIEKIGVL